MLIRRTSFVAFNYTRDWDKAVAADDLFFQGSFPAEVPHKPVGKTGPLNCRLRLWAAINNIRDYVTLSFEKKEEDTCSDSTYTTEAACLNAGEKWEWKAAPGGVAKGLPGGAAGTYDAADPVYADEDHKWIIGKTATWADGQVSHYFAYVYFQFATNEVFKTEDLGVYRAKVVGNMGAGNVTKYSSEFEISE